MSATSIPVLVINMERARERWARISASAKTHGVTLERVEAVDGRNIPSGVVSPLDAKGFERDHGQTAMPGEVGVFISHGRALARVAAGKAKFAVLLEDDVLFTDRFQSTVAALAELEGWDLIKLRNHRTKGFRAATTLSNGVEVGRALHGPQGSAAAYLVRASAIPRILKGLSVMTLPVDIALERGWAMGVAVFTVAPDVLEPTHVESTIADRIAYRAARLPWWKRLTAARFRFGEILARTKYFQAMPRL